MKLTPLASNMTVIEFLNGTEVLFSYETPVATFGPSGFLQTEQHYSPTTTRHINKWKNILGVSSNQTTPQAFLNNLIGAK